MDLEVDGTYYTCAVLYCLRSGFHFWRVDIGIVHGGGDMMYKFCSISEYTFAQHNAHVVGIIKMRPVRCLPCVPLAVCEMCATSYAVLGHLLLLAVPCSISSAGGLRMCLRVLQDQQVEG